GASGISTREGRATRRWPPRSLSSVNFWRARSSSTVPSNPGRWGLCTHYRRAPVRAVGRFGSCPGQSVSWAVPEYLRSLNDGRCVRYLRERPRLRQVGVALPPPHQPPVGPERPDRARRDAPWRQQAAAQRLRVLHQGREGRPRLSACGHQNHLPNNATMAGVTSARTTSVSSTSPTAMVVPICAMLSTLLPSSASMVIPKTMPAVVTTPPVPPKARMMPVLSPAAASCLIRSASNRL